jgi:hypothetical protein
VSALSEEGGVVLVTRNGAGHLTIEGRTPEGAAAGFATYAEGSADFRRALDEMVARCLPTPEVRCAYCGEAPEGRTMVALSGGRAMHRNPCWSTSLDEAVQDD